MAGEVATKSGARQKVLLLAILLGALFAVLALTNVIDLRARFARRVRRLSHLRNHSDGMYSTA